MINREREIRKAVYVAAIIVIAGCVPVLIPQVRSALIAFGETRVLHRKLTSPDFWDWQLLLSSFAGLFVSGLLLFCGSRKFPAFSFSAEKKARLYTAVEIALIGLLLLLVTILAASNRSIWLDEVYSLAPARHSWKELIRIQSADVHPPLFFLALKLWRELFGEGIFFVKILSMLPVILTMVFVTLFLNKEFSRKTAVFFLLCCIASASVIHYSIEIRMYSLAMFFVTMAAVSVWYIITTGKTRWYAAFLLFAEGAAYTHIYAALTAGIGYLLLLWYVLKYDRKKTDKTLGLAPLAVLLYLPWLPVIIGGFTRVSTDFWIKPLNLKTVAGYVYFIFDAGNPVMALGFCFLFLAVFCYFLVRPKTPKGLFALGGLSCMIILAGLGILVSILIRPLLVDRYLFPACGLVWLFFAIVCGSIPYKRAAVFVCGVLLVLGFTSFSASLYKEREEDRGFTRFYTYLQKELQPEDMFIFPPEESNHLPGITAYLFPEHDQVHELQYATSLGTAFREMYDRRLVAYKDLSADDSLAGRRTWVIVSEEDNQGNPMSFVIPPESKAQFREDFGWGGYRFKIYYTEHPEAFAGL